MKWRRTRLDRLSKLAKAIETLGKRDRSLADEAARVADLRRDGAVALYALCRGFVDRLNGKLSEPAVQLDPGDFRAENFVAHSRNLFQINLRGRLLQLEFESTEQLTSTEDFRSPYVLQGSVRAFNQELLDHHTIGEQQIFFCPKGEGGRWLFQDRRTYRAGPLTEDYLIAELERLL